MTQQDIEAKELSKVIQRLPDYASSWVIANACIRANYRKAEIVQQETADAIFSKLLSQNCIVNDSYVNSAGKRVEYSFIDVDAVREIAKAFGYGG